MARWRRLKKPARIYSSAIKHKQQAVQLMQGIDVASVGCVEPDITASATAA
jgi:hypothetical protein